VPRLLSTQDDFPDSKTEECEKQKSLPWGTLYLNANASCDFGLFDLPKYASREAVEVLADHGKHVFSLQFNRNGHVRIKVGKDMVVDGGRSPLTFGGLIPETFEVAGTWRDSEKEGREESSERARREESNAKPEGELIQYESSHGRVWEVLMMLELIPIEPAGGARHMSTANHGLLLSRHAPTNRMNLSSSI
jgi:hypothetical protein